MRMRNITLVGLFTLLLAASFWATSPDREAALDPELVGMGMQPSEDTPITISDGSPLTLHCELPWVEYDDNVVFPDDVHRVVTDISIWTDREKAPRVFKLGKSQRCEVVITYGSMKLTVKTNRFGQVLRVSTSEGTFVKDWKPTDPAYTLYIDKEGAFISNVQVNRSGMKPVDLKLPPGPKRIRFSYRRM